MNDADQRGLCAALAELLSYPGAGLPGALRASRALAGQDTPAGAALTRFQAHAGVTGLERLQEAYTAAFDLQPACAPYFGHHLLGDSPLRGPLLAHLAGLYARDGFAPREELPDHVAEVLRFLAVGREGADRDDLLRDGLFPALERMAEALREARDPYQDVVSAARELLATMVAPSPRSSPPPGGGEEEYVSLPLPTAGGEESVGRPLPTAGGEESLRQGFRPGPPLQLAGEGRGEGVGEEQGSGREVAS